MHHVWHDLGDWLGLTSPNGAPYLFWSGFGSDAAKLTLLGGAFHLLRKHHRHLDERERR